MTLTCMSGKQNIREDLSLGLQGPGEDMTEKIEAKRLNWSSMVTQLVRWTIVCKSQDHGILTSHADQAFLPTLGPGQGRVPGRHSKQPRLRRSVAVINQPWASGQ